MIQLNTHADKKCKIEKGMCTHLTSLWQIHLVSERIA